MAQGKAVPWHMRLAPAFAVSGYLFLLLWTGMYLLTLFDHPWLRGFEIGWYAWGGVAVAVMAVVIAVAFFVPRFWCLYFCPVGAVADLTEAGVQAWKKVRAR
jgi:polyferredoxin